mgnify:CR=1 FL=1
MYKIGVNTGYIGYEFEKNIIISSYDMIHNYSDITYTPKNWTFEASNDGNNWIVLDTRTNESFTQNVRKSFKFINKLAYKSYRINITLNNGRNQLAISVLRMFENKLIRSISGGIAYADTNGNKSNHDQSKGAWPINNEYDKYIVNSDLQGTIAKGDNNIWHHTGIWILCKETPVTGLIGATGSASGTRIQRTMTSVISQNVSGLIYTQLGFRPVLEFIEEDSKASTLFY